MKEILLTEKEMIFLVLLYFLAVKNKTKEQKNKEVVFSVVLRTLGNSLAILVLVMG